MLQLANGKQQFLDQNGAPLAGGLVYHYAPGTTNPVATYKDPAGSAANKNPVPLDSRGQAVIWGTGTFRQVVTDASGVLVWDQLIAAPDVSAPANALQALLAGSGGLSLLGWLRVAAGAVKAAMSSWMGWQTPSVLDFMTDDERADVLAGTCLIDVSGAVQKAVLHCLTNGKDLLVEGLCRIDEPVNIDRAVDTTTDEFHIRGRNSKAGFWTSKPISIFSSSLPGFTPGGAASENIVFDKVRFEASDNTVNCFALDGNAFLRIRAKNCYFRKIRLAYTSNFFQSWYLDRCQIRKMKGIFMEAAVAGDSYVGLDGYGFDLHFSGNIFEDGDPTQSAFLKLAGNYNGGSMTGGLFEGSTGPFMEVAGGSGVDVSGNYFEAVAQSCFKLGKTFSISFTGNRFGTGSDPAYWPIDCQTAYTVAGQGNWSEGNIYKSAMMSSTRPLTDLGFYTTSSKGLLSFGDVAYNGKISDDESHADLFARLEAQQLLAGVADYSVGATRQKVMTFQGDGVSGVAPISGFNVYTTAGFRDTCRLDVYVSDVVYGDYPAPVLSMSNDLLETAGRLKVGMAVDLPQRTTANRMAYAPGRMYYDTTIGKIVVGGASGWETVQSS